MGQADLLKWFEDHPGWHDVCNVAKVTGKHPSNIRKILVKLRQYGDLECRNVEGSNAKIYRVNKYGL